MANHKKLIGIIGGMGPEAGVMLQKYIHIAAKHILKTVKDSDFPSVIHHSLPSMIADRTEYLLGLSEENPGDAAVAIAQSLSMVGEALNLPVIAGVACNTFHTKPIWEKFIAQTESIQNLSTINMVDITIDYILNEINPPSKIAIFGTLGLNKEKLYESKLAPLGYSVYSLQPEQQQTIHKAIYDHEFGLKANPEKIKKACNLIISVVESLKKEKIKKIIFGCTELSIAFPNDSDPMFIDPMMVLAEKLVRLSQE